MFCRLVCGVFAMRQELDGGRYILKVSGVAYFLSTSLPIFCADREIGSCSRFVLGSSDSASLASRNKNKDLGGILHDAQRNVHVLFQVEDLWAGPPPPYGTYIYTEIHRLGK